jgi:SAM-dependent methyltransferase
MIQERFKNAKNFSTFLIDASNPKQMEKLQKFEFDTAISMNVFEHIKDDVSAFKNVFNVLKPGAHFMVIVPAMKQLYAILDYEGGHFRRYNRKDLTSRLKVAGFQIVHSRYINFPGAVGWFINYTLMKKRLFAKGTFKMYNNLVPLFKLTESIVKFPFGMSVIAIAKKPEQI